MTVSVNRRLGPASAEPDRLRKRYKTGAVGLIRGLGEETAWGWGGGGELRYPEDREDQEPEEAEHRG